MEERGGDAARDPDWGLPPAVPGSVSWFWLCQLFPPMDTCCTWTA